MFAMFLRSRFVFSASSDFGFIPRAKVLQLSRRQAFGGFPPGERRILRRDGDGGGSPPKVWLDQSAW